jgi:hypothetical protein
MVTDADLDALREIAHSGGRPSISVERSLFADIIGEIDRLRSALDAANAERQRLERQTLGDFGGWGP